MNLKKRRLTLTNRISAYVCPKEGCPFHSSYSDSIRAHYRTDHLRSVWVGHFVQEHFYFCSHPGDFEIACCTNSGTFLTQFQEPGWYTEKGWRPAEYIKRTESDLARLRAMNLKGSKYRDPVTKKGG